VEDLDRAIQHYLAPAELGENLGESGGSEAVERLRPEIGNLEAIALRALSGKEAETGIEAALGIGRLFQWTGLGSRLPLERALSVSPDERTQARCLERLGRIAFDCSDHDDARARYEEALPLFRRVGQILGKANCIQGLGDIALKNSDQRAARKLFEEALGLYSRIQEPYSMGWAHFRLARIAERPEERQDHIDAAREAWTRIKRPDLVARLDQELGPAPDVKN